MTKYLKNKKVNGFVADVFMTSMEFGIILLLMALVYLLSVAVSFS